MLRKYVVGVAAAAMISGAAAGAQTDGSDDAQTQQPGSTGTHQSEPATTQSPTDQPASADQHRADSQSASTTLTGCVYREEDVPGRTPNIAERAGVMEDYILAVAGSGSEPQATGTSGIEGTAGTSGVGAGLFKLEHANDEDLRAVVGKRVEVTGRLDAEEGDTMGAGTSGAPAGDTSLGPDRIELPEFEVTSIREVGGDCPAQPEMRR